MHPLTTLVLFSVSKTLPVVISKECAVQAAYSFFFFLSKLGNQFLTDLFIYIFVRVQNVLAIF